MSCDFQKVEELYHQALLKPMAERAHFLESACGGDEELHREVEVLLACQEKIGQFMESPAMDVAAWMLARSKDRKLIGSQLGPYEILSLLGAGGMGEVYRAHDTKLNRDVALKVLPAAFANDAERMARFEREAHVLASLNHPNIASIYGLEESGKVRALIMELVEGPTLVDRLEKEPFRLEESLAIAKQMAEALECAHEKGIMHRDLKPANVKVTAEGMVKVLDFGLAKALEGGTTTGDLENSPKRTAAATESGVILGTASYMAPEQARGKAVDRRADIWSFGVVFYEMLTGRRLYNGETVSDTLAAVLKMEPDWNALPAEVPHGIRRLLRRCLAKDRRERLQAIGDARIEIEESLSAPARGAEAEAIELKPVASGRRREQLAWILAAVFLMLAAISLAVANLRQRPLGLSLTQFVIPPPENTSFAPISFAAISPDGRRLAFVAAFEGKRLIWVRSLDSLYPRALAGTEGALAPFWSPDNRFIGFFAQSKLKKIEVTGGPPLTLCDAGEGYGGTWNRDGSILFSPNTFDGLYRISDSGGVVTPVTTLDSSHRQLGHKWPHFLPDGRHFLFRASYAQPGNNAINLGALDSKDTRRIVSADSSVAYASPGYILFVREGTLLAQPFDEKLLVTVGGPFPLAERVRSERNFYRAAFTVSESGVLAYESGNNAMNRSFAWFDREGKRLETVGGSGEYTSFELSADGKRVAVEILDPETRFTDIWMLDLKRGAMSRLTFDPAWDYNPVWSPDGTRIIFGSLRELPGNLYTKLSSGDGSDELLLRGDTGQIAPTDWSLDGRFIIYQQSIKSRGDIWALPLFGDRQPKPLVQTEFDEGEGRLSPDGRWLAYSSNESGRYEVYVRPFPATGNKKQVSAGGGANPRWRQDGKELFYLAANRKLMAAAVYGESTFEPGLPKSLFELPGSDVSVSLCPYAVTANGQHFLISLPAEGANSAPITVVLNWTAILRK